MDRILRLSQAGLCAESSTSKSSTPQSFSSTSDVEVVATPDMRLRPKPVPTLRYDARHGAMAAAGGSAGHGDRDRDDPWRAGGYDYGGGEDEGEDEDENERKGKGKGKGKNKHHKHHTQWSEEEVEAWLRATPPLRWPDRKQGASSAHSAQTCPQASGPTRWDSQRAKGSRKARTTDTGRPSDPFNNGLAELDRTLRLTIEARARALVRPLPLWLQPTPKLRIHNHAIFEKIQNMDIHLQEIQDHLLLTDWDLLINHNSVLSSRRCPSSCQQM